MEDQRTYHGRSRDIIEKVGRTIAALSVLLLLLGFAAMGAITLLAPGMLLSGAFDVMPAFKGNLFPY